MQRDRFDSESGGTGAHSADGPHSEGAARTAHTGQSSGQQPFFEAMSAARKIDSPENFIAWTQGPLQAIFPHGMLACGIGEITGKGSRPRKIISCNFPVEYIQALHQPNGTISSPLIARWLQVRQPVLFEKPGQHVASSPWLENFERFGLKNAAVHGLCDIQGGFTSFFAFARIPGRLESRHAALLDTLVPHLHVALIRALSNPGAAQKTATQSALTGREREILKWLGEGKTNWEIAQLLKISENTVKNHVQRILVKLKVNNRAQAVAKGLNTSAGR